MQINILTYDTLDSTNTEALKQAKQGADEGLCIVARQQSAGRGRHGRTWVSEKYAGLYFSILLRPKIDPKSLTLITLMSGVAVYETLAELDIKPDIKWVNDVLVNDKKIAGILAETTDTPIGLAVVVGIGINLRSVSFPPEISSNATSVVSETTEDLCTADILEGLTKQLQKFYQLLLDDPNAIVDEWRQRSSYYSGKQVRVATANGTIIGVTDGVEPDGALRVRQDNGTSVVLHAGDVQRLRSEPN
jgi:BirA family transcriptional regulator, biotin operon repressor / biotin---[acetyl-CoA-carboxylase] ligase